jgi:hypothetical protein
MTHGILFLTCLALLALTGCTASAPLASPPAAADEPLTATVYVVDRGWHTDIGLSAAEIHGPLAQAESGLRYGQFFLFGFGDRRYVLKRSTDVFDMVAALFPAAGALLVTGLETTPEESFPEYEVLQLPVTQAQLDDLEQGLWHYFDRGTDGRPVMIGTGPYAGSTFYATSAIYDAFFTCNSWSAGLLEMQACRSGRAVFFSPGKS